MRASKYFSTRLTVPKAALVALLITASQHVASQGIRAISIAPQLYTHGSPVEIKVEVSHGRYEGCSLFVDYGDGSTDNFRTTPVPIQVITFRKIYEKPGTFNVEVAGRLFQGCYGSASTSVKILDESEYKIAFELRAREAAQARELQEAKAKALADQRDRERAQADEAERRLVTERLAEEARVKRAAAEEREARRQRDLVAIARWTEYQKREKTLLEQVLNYTTTTLEDGSASEFWISGENGQHKCVLKRYSAPASEARSLTLEGVFEAMARSMSNPSEVDFRMFNPRGVRIQKFNNGAVIVGDENMRISGHENTVTDRLRKGWGLALQECPPAQRRAF